MNHEILGALLAVFAIVFVLNTLLLLSQAARWYLGVPDLPASAVERGRLSRRLCVLLVVTTALALWLLPAAAWNLL